MKEEWQLIDIEPRSRWERYYLNAVSDTYSKWPIVAFLVLSGLCLFIGLYFLNSSRDGLSFFLGFAFLFKAARLGDQYIANRIFRRLLTKQTAQDNQFSGIDP